MFIKKTCSDVKFVRFKVEGKKAVIEKNFPNLPNFQNFMKFKKNKIFIHVIRTCLSKLEKSRSTDYDK